MEEIEIWKDIPNYVGYYQVSSWGRIKSVSRIISRSNGFNSRTSKEKILKLQVDKHGYARILLRINKVVKLWSVHRLVAITFISNPNNKKEVNHKDLNKLNNYVNNLEWCSRHENQLHSINARKGQITVRKPYKRKGVIQYTLEGEFIAKWPSTTKAVEQFNISNTRNITKCCNNKQHTAYEYKWRWA